MRITPLDVRKQEFRKAVRGLDADEVHAFLATVADEYEFVLTDNKKLRERVIELDEKVGEYRNMEKTLRDTLLTAERVMTEARQNARKEADLILRDAQMKASQEVAGINGRVEALHQQIRELRGYRDSYLARLHSLSEAQLGLIDSYRKDFESTDTRIERAAAPASEPVTAPKTVSAPEAASPSIPAYETQPSAGGDEWRAYDLEAAKSASRAQPMATAHPAAPVAGASGHVAPVTPSQPEFTPEALESPAPAKDAPAHLHTPAPMPTEAPVFEPDYPLEEESSHVEQVSAEEYDARVASVADAWSGAVPRVEAGDLPVGDAAAIDEVSAALGMFTEDAESLAGPASMEGESTSVPPVAGVPSSPWPSNELAQDGVPVEPVGHAGGPEGADGDMNHASTESDEHSEEGRWSLSRIARGLTGS
jgi:cell division initiation protein